MRKDLFDELLESVTEAKAITQGRTAPSRAFQADEILRLKNWEQKRRRPDGPG